MKTMRALLWALALAMPLSAAAQDAGETPILDEEQVLPGPRHWRDRCQPTPEFEDPACAPLLENWGRVRKVLLDPATPSSAPVASTRWDRARTPENWDLVSRRFSLTEKEKAAVRESGFAVLERLDLGTYALAYHEIYQSQLPIYVSADSLLHAVFRSHEVFVAELERDTLWPALAKVVAAMATELPAAAKSWPAETARDAAVYLAVAQELLSEAPGEEVIIRAELTAPVPVALGAADAKLARKLVDEMHSARGIETVELFGRKRLVDFGRYKPRGPYADPVRGLGPYFRGATWLSRLELNLVSRACRSSEPGAAVDREETPREVAAALALAQLAQRAKVLDELEKVDRAWTALAGARPDVSFAELLALAAKAGIDGPADPHAQEKLAHAIGERFKRTERTHPMPEGASHDLPVIATMIGPRLGLETMGLQGVVHGAVPGRTFPKAADVAYALGHDRALVHLGPELKRYPELKGQLAKARESLAAVRRGGDLQAAWFNAVRALADKPAGSLPTYMGTEAFADLRLASAVAGYGHVKHAYVLMAGEVYGEGGCEIPDGFVEPVPAVLDALIDYAVQAGSLSKQLGHEAGQRHFEGVVEVMRILRRIVADELAGRPLTLEERQFLNMVVEVPPLSYSPHCKPYYLGWYRHLFYPAASEPSGEFDRADFISSYFTDRRGIAYVGARRPVIGLFVVDSAGPARVFAGPVADVYEYRGGGAGPLTDQEARAGLKGTQSPWNGAHWLKAMPEVPLRVEWDYEKAAWKLTGRGAPVNVTVVQRGFHREVLEEVTHPVGARPVFFKISRMPSDLRGPVELRVGDFRYEVLCDGGAGGMGGYCESGFAIGGMKLPEPQ
ncbi:MAG: DUF3160 domain-containing protein [Myxococcales bacterium]